MFDCNVEGTYVSTRGCAGQHSAARAVLDGLAPDGGLYAMRELPKLPASDMLGKSACAISAAVLSALLPGLAGGNMAGIVSRAYTGRFETPDITPLVDVGDKYVLELFRGPTCAFKDVALCVLPGLMAAAKAREGVDEETLILVATSGDTGKAALSGFADAPGMKIAVFYPDGGVSAIQRAQMVTQSGKNVAVCAVKGNFDDAQTGVKRIFAQASEKPQMLPAGVGLSSANSINAGRLAPQVMYYYKAYCELVESGAVKYGDKVDFAVPTGNFGDILAGYIAKRMGVPVGRLICASNSNDVLTEFLETGVYNKKRRLYKTASPSMDILVSSNLERLLYYESGADTALVRSLMQSLVENGEYVIDKVLLSRIRDTFAAYSCGDAATFATIKRVFDDEGYLLDTHTAVAWNAAEKLRSDRPMVVLSTASPFKFAGDVLRALTGAAPEDGFDAMDELSRVSGLPIPAGLSGLRGARELHTDAIEREDMLPYVMRKAAEL